MKRSTASERQIASTLPRAEAGTRVEEVCREASADAWSPSGAVQRAMP